jgi:hypothetical protein
MTVATRQANFLLPDDVLSELKSSVPKRQQSRVVAEALRKELRRIKLAKALQTSFGAWKDKGHPELKKGTEAFVRSLRASTRDRRAK